MASFSETDDSVRFAYFVPKLLPFERMAARPPANVESRFGGGLALNVVCAVFVAASSIGALKVFSSTV